MMASSSDMSDSEDSTILDEIRDLENILATTPAKLTSLPKSSDDVVHEPSDINTISTNSSSSNDNTFDHVTTIFNLNKQLIEELTNAKNEVSAVLEDCNKKLQMIDQKIKQYTKTWTDNSKIMISTAGMPYFKDKDYFGAPKNDDVKLKTARGELQIVNFQKSCMWTARDRTILLNAIYDEVMISILDHSKKKDKEKTTSSQGTFKKVLSAKNMEPIVCTMRKKKFDWLKIAAMNFDDKHSADECCAMWNLLLHPDINKSNWTGPEEVKLKKFAKLYGYKDWDQIAKKLNTKRSGYQCFIKYNCTGNLLKLTERTWTVKDDERLCDIVAKCRIGNFIPWTKVTSYVKLRCKNQIYFRWMFKLAPHLKKGRFTKEESETLLQGVNKFGTNFTLIAALYMPDRTSVQLNDHYQTLMSKESARHWTLSSDMKLVNLYKKIGPDWCKIANNFKYKNRTQVRHRYTSLFNYTSKGLSLLEIPRQKNEHSMQEDTESSDEEYNIEVMENDIDDKIDQLLIEHFLNLNTVEYCHNQNLYDAKELSEDTKELYSILENFQANLLIPESFNYLPLTERDKQLLHSLKAYIKLKCDRQNSNEIKTLRLKMFGPEDNEKQKDHFIPPLPFEVYSNHKNDKQTQNIDCAVNINNKFIVNVNKEFDTPESIICLIGGLEENIKFNKFANFQHTSTSCQNINLSSNNFTIKNSNSSTTNNLVKCNQLKHNIGKNSNLINEKLTAIDETIGESSTWLRCLNYTIEVANIPGSIIEPDCTTLLSYRNFITLQNIYNIEKTLDVTRSVKNNQDAEQTDKVERTYELLKRRLVQLFKYPITMSHLPLKEMNDSMGLISIGSKNIVNKKRKITQINVFKRKKARTDPSETFIYDTNGSMQFLDISKNV